MTKKPGMTLIIGMGKPEPPKYGPGEKPEPEMEEQEEKTAPASEEEKKAQAGYHGADQACAYCEHMGRNGKCTKFGFKVEDGGWCQSFTPTEMEEGEQEFGGDTEEPEEGEAA